MSMIPDEVYDKLLAQPDTGPLTSLANEGPDPEPVETPADPAIDPAEETPAGEETPPAEDPIVEEEPVVAPAAIAPALTPELMAAAVEALRAAGVEIKVPEAKTPEVPTEPVVPPEIKALLEHEDPAVQESGKALLASHQAQERRLAAIENRLAAADDQATIAAVEKHVIEVQKTFAIEADVPKLGEDGKQLIDPATKKPITARGELPITDKMMDEVAKYAEEHPNTAAELTVEELTRRVFPRMVKRATPNAETPASPPPGAGRRTTRVPGQPPAAQPIPAGSAGGRTPSTKLPVPANETMEQAVDRGLRELNFTR